MMALREGTGGHRAGIVLSVGVIRLHTSSRELDARMVHYGAANDGISLRGGGGNWHCACCDIVG